MLAKLRKPVIILASLLALYAVIGFFIIPALIQSQGPKILTEKIGRPVSLSKARFNPFTLSLTLDGFEIDETDGQKILAFDRLLIDLTLRSLLKWAVDLEKVQLTAPYLWVDILADGRLNLLELLPVKANEEEPEEKGPFPIWIDNLQIENGHVRFDDSSHKTPFEADITPIDLQFENLTTLAVEGGADTLTTELKAGGRLSWTGTLSLNPLLAKGHLQLADASMPKVWEYLEDRFHFQFARGTLGLDADLLFDAEGKTKIPELQVSNGKVTLEQFLLTEKGAEDALIDIPQLAVDGIEFDLAKQRLAVASVTSKGARLKGWRDAGGAINYQTLFALDASAAAPKGSKAAGTSKSKAAAAGSGSNRPKSSDNAPWAVQIDTIALSDYALDVEDRSGKKPFAITLDPLNLTVDHFTTAQGAQIGVELTTKVAERGQTKSTGGSLAINGSFALEPLASQGHLRVDNIDLRPLVGYLPETIPLELKRGMLNVAGDYHFDSSSSPVDLQISKGHVALQHLELGEKGGKAPLISIPSLALDGIGVELAKQQLTVASIASKDAVLKGWRDADGVINYQKLFGGKTGQSGAQSKVKAKPAQAPNHTPKASNHSQPARLHTTDKSQGKTPAWSVRVDRLALKNYALRFEDRSVKKPVTLDLSPMNLNAEKISNKPGAKLRIGLDSTVNGDGRIKFKGNVVLDPLSTDITVAIDRIKLKTVQPYLEPFARIELVSGAFNAKGTMRFASGGNGGPSLHYAGTAGIADFHSKDTITNRDFVKWKTFQAKGIDFDLRPMRLEIAEFLADRPYARVTIKKDHSTNIGDIFSSSKGHSSKKSAHSRGKSHSKAHKKRSTATSKMFPLAIKKIRITNGSSDFSDLSLILPFSVTIKELHGAIKGVSSKRHAKTTIALDGKVNRISPVTIRGTIDPFATRDHADIDLRFKNLSMPTVTPYMAQFAGYRIDKGKMSLDLDYKVHKGLLHATNKIEIDHLVLGEKVDNPKATSLPIKLALALMTDADGKIILDFPITGSLEDPHFDIGAVVVKVLVNIITKAVTAPFNLLANLVGSSSDLSVIGFEPGSSELSAEAEKKLDAVVKGLKERTELRLDIKGMAYENADWPPLAEARLERQLKAAKARESGEAAKTASELAQIQLSKEEYQHLLLNYFRTQFPNARIGIYAEKLIEDEPLPETTIKKLKKKLVAAIDKAQLRALAHARAQAIFKRVTGKGGISSDRVFLLDSKIEQAAGKEGVICELDLSA